MNISELSPRDRHCRMKGTTTRRTEDLVHCEVDPAEPPPTKSNVKDFQIDSDILYWGINRAGENSMNKINAMLRRAMEEERAEAS